MKDALLPLRAKPQHVVSSRYHVVRAERRPNLQEAPPLTAADGGGEKLTRARARRVPTMDHELGRSKAVPRACRMRYYR